MNNPERDMRQTLPRWIALTLLCLAPVLTPAQAVADHSVARQWNEALLDAIRGDYARPTVHARNLFHSSAAMWDAWAAFDPAAQAWLVHETAQADDPEAAREAVISHAAYHLLSWRFRESPGADDSLASFDALMASLGLDPAADDDWAQLGRHIAQAYIELGLADGANESGGYANRQYESVNDPLIMALPGNPDMADPNRYQPLSLSFFFDQAGNPLPRGFPEFLSPEWGRVTPFALHPRDLSIHRRDDYDWWTWHDPGAPPLLGGEGDADWKAGFEQVVEWSGLLDPADGVRIDISPASRGRNTLGTNDGRGYPRNPRTGLPYERQVVPAGDYYRVLAEFWADGPDSETPPGHWFTIANTVSDHPEVAKRLWGEGERLDDLEWDLKLYLVLGGAMHDVAISAWGVKGRYDYVRPVSALRYMADRGQSSDPGAPNFHPDGITLKPGRIEQLTLASTAEGERHAHLAGDDGEHLGKIAVWAWRGPDFIDDPDTDTAGVGWILLEDWWPYQRPSFVTPPFAGYVSGHSTYSRAAAEVLTGFTGDAYFPGGLGEFQAPRNEFLVFEEGPSEDIVLQWARYYDAADECSLSRIYGGIHPPADDIPGRLMGREIGLDALERARRLFDNEGSLRLSVQPELPTQADIGLAGFTGSWFNPDRDGEGWIVQTLDDESAVLYWFTYDLEGRPTWMHGVARRVGNALSAEMFTTTGAPAGTSPEDWQSTEAPWGLLTVMPVQCGQAEVVYRAHDEAWGRGRIPARRLTGLDGLDCRTDRSAQVLEDAAPMAGAWQVIDRDGEGYIVETLDGGLGVVYWFTFDEQGRPTWRSGTGPALFQQVDAQLHEFRGPVFGEAYDPADLVSESFGSVQVRGEGCEFAWTTHRFPGELGETVTEIRKTVLLDGLPACPD